MIIVEGKGKVNCLFLRFPSAVFLCHSPGKGSREKKKERRDLPLLLSPPPEWDPHAASPPSNTETLLRLFPTQERGGGKEGERFLAFSTTLLLLLWRWHQTPVGDSVLLLLLLFLPSFVVGAVVGSAMFRPSPSPAWLRPSTTSPSCLGNFIPSKGEEGK